MRISRVAVALSVVNVGFLAFLLTQRRAIMTPPVDVLRAGAIELVDTRGQTRARLNVEPDGEVVFRLIDTTGAIRVKLGASENGSGLLLLDDQTEPGIHMLADDEGARVTLTGKDGAQEFIQP